MNTCDVCLLSKPSTQQCRAIRLYLWNLAPQSVPDPVNNTDAGLRRLAVHVGSIKKARRWLSRWNLDYMDRKATCIPQFVIVSSLQDDPLATSSSGSLPPVSQGIPLSATSIGGEPQQSSASILSASLPILSVHSNAAGSHLPSGQSAPPPALPSLDHRSLLRSPPPEDTLFQVVAQEEVVGSIEPTVSAFADPLSEGEGIQAVFDQYTAKRPEAGCAGVSTHSAAPTTLVATSLTRDSLPQPSPCFRIPLDPSLVGVRPLFPPSTVFFGAS